MLCAALCALALDTATLSEVSARLMQHPTSQISVGGERDELLQTRLPGLAIARTRVAPSRIDSAGRGLFATRAIEEGELVTLYPGDALVSWPDEADNDEEDEEDEDEDEDEEDEEDEEELSEGEEARAKADALRCVLERGLDADVTFSTHGKEGTRWADNWATRERTFVGFVWDYGVQEWPNRAIIADPENVSDSAYLGHMANDGASCGRPGNDAAVYEAASRRAANVKMSTDSMLECHHALVATRRIEAGDEINLSYGASYWLTRLTSPPTRVALSDGATYYGEVDADGSPSGGGEYTSSNTGSAGSRYVGSFVNGQFEGHGTFHFSDGRAQIGAYRAGAAVGVHVGWSADRMSAWRVDASRGSSSLSSVVMLPPPVGGPSCASGLERHEISLEEASSLAKDLGLPMPPVRKR